MQDSRLLSIRNATTGSPVCSRARLADSLRLRLVGLLGQRAMEPGSGLLISPSSGVHTFAMRFAIDVVSLDKNLRVLGVWDSVGAWRVRGLSLRTRSVLELPGGCARLAGIAVGDHLAVTAAATTRAVSNAC